MPEQTYTIKEVATLLSVSEAMIKLLLDEGELFFKKNNGEYFIPATQFNFDSTNQQGPRSN
jgi:hypothetical protein